MNSHDRQFWANNIVIFVYDYNNCKNIFYVLKTDQSQQWHIQMSLQGNCPRKKGWGYKDVSE